MKKIFHYILLAGLSAGMVSCDKYFDRMEGDLTKNSAEVMVSTEAGLQGLLANLYGYMPMNAFSTGDQQTLFASVSREIPAYGSGVAKFWNYTQIRSINKFLEALESAVEKGIIDEKTRASYEGEGLFIRAYCYFAQVRTYGGIPIVDHSLDEAYDGKENSGLYFPRLTEKESWDWVLDQFQKAADLLPETPSGEMRICKYTALGMKARAALWAASESKYWNRASLSKDYVAVQKKFTYMEDSYAPDYYAQAIQAAEAVIKSGKYSLFGADPKTVEEAVSNLDELFQNYKTQEGLLGRNYVSGSATTANGTQGWGPNQVIFGLQVGQYSATLNLADEYDNYTADRSRTDGTIVTKVSGDEVSYLTDPVAQMKPADVTKYVKYDAVTGPFENKDARFQAWVVYPGCTFRKTVINIQGGMVLPDGSVSVYPAKNDAVTVNGTDYYPYGGQGDNNSSFYRITNGDTNSSNHSFYSFMIRKYLDPDTDNKAPQSPWYDLRYAEVLLTYAEAVKESGKGDATLARECLNEIRHRAGFKDDVELTMENILHEWKVEFAFENSWSSVLYRRRGFYNPAKSDLQEEGTLGRKLTLIPMLDLSGDSPKYIFLRSLPYCATPHFKNYNGSFRFDSEQYYEAIPNYVNNGIEDNNK